MYPVCFARFPALFRFRPRRFFRPGALLLACLLAGLPVAGFAADAPAATGKTVGALPGYQIIPLGRGHNNRLCLAATAGGKKGLMILDTGAGGTLLNNDSYGFLRANGTAKVPANLLKEANINGMSADVVSVPDFKIGAFDLGSFPALLSPRRFLYEQSPYDTHGGRQYDGIIGENILRPCNAVVDCGRLMLYLNTDRTRKLNLISAFTNGGWTGVPMSDVAGDFAVPCMINGHKFRLLVDTGAPFTNMDRNLLRGAGIDSRNLPIKYSVIGTRAEEGALVRLESLQIGGYTASGIHMLSNEQSIDRLANRTGSTSEGSIIGLLGGDALASNGAVVDIGDKTLFLKHVAKESATR